MEEKETESAVQAQEMDKPETANYDKVYTISEVFINDLKTCLGDMEFNKADQFIRFAIAKKDGIITADLQEFLNKLGLLPWRYISPLMSAMRDSDVMSKYFVLEDEQSK